MFLIEKHIHTINHELGVVIGQLNMIKWVTGGTFFAVIGKMLYDILIGG
jgi:hypothetical protein